jgi:hypothetical protein
MAESDADSLLDLDRPKKPNLRGLWGLMREMAESGPDTGTPQTGDTTPTEELAETDGAAGDEAESAARPRGPAAPTDEAFSSPGRGLWALMGAGTVSPDATDAAETEVVEPSHDVDSAEPSLSRERPSEPATEGPGGRGLWAVMQAMAATDAPPIETPPHNSDWIRKSRAEAETDSTDDLASEPVPTPVQSAAAIARTAAVSPPSSLSPLRGFIAPPPASLPTEVVPSRVALLAAVAGGLALPLSLLAALESFLWRLPASAVGFFGLAAGLAAWNEVARPRSRYSGKGMAIAGIVCGVVAMFVGSLVVAPLGVRYRESTGDRMTTRHLVEMGQALDQAYDKQGHYPDGALVGPDGEGRDRSLHGWMTSLLPYVGEAELFASIDLTKPYNAVKNQPAMKQRVAAFEAAGGDLTPVESGFAAAHFAGVGGKIDAAGQGEVHLGVFERDSAVRREQIVDGLSNTLIVGEVAHRYPAWGDPENWRMVGSGLNKQPHGFGNAAGTGATFLKADGSVQFFSNRVSSDILLRMSTRDGNDPFDDDEL